MASIRRSKYCTMWKNNPKKPERCGNSPRAANPQQRSKAPLTSHPHPKKNAHPLQTTQNKKIRTNPRLPGHRGKAPIRIRVPKKLKPIPKKTSPPTTKWKINIIFNQSCCNFASELRNAHPNKEHIRPFKTIQQTSKTNYANENINPQQEHSTSKSPPPDNKT